ncbi:hypothetical protein [Flavobacterium sp.]|uniref:hypothetical protein n=1 Tax=Flavobacterium sp. TaxID=239 RepID=UPI0038FD077D
MSILNLQPEVTKAERVKRLTDDILETPRETAEQLFQQWERAVRMLWSKQGDITPEDKLAAMGADAGELIAMSRALTAFLTTTCTGKRDDLVAKIEARLATIPAFTVQADGTVTIDPVTIDE